MIFTASPEFVVTCTGRLLGANCPTGGRLTAKCGDFLREGDKPTEAFQPYYRRAESVLKNKLLIFPGTCYCPGHDER